MTLVKLIRVWRPLVSDFEMVELEPTETVGQLKARFKASLQAVLRTRRARPKAYHR